MLRSGKSYQAMKRKLVYLLALTGFILLTACTIFPNPSVNKITATNRVDDNFIVPMSITIWNLGYGGLGKEQNFIADGGKSWRVSEKQFAEKYVENISSDLMEISSDIFLLQEMAKPSFVNRQTSLMNAVLDELSEYSGLYSPQYLVNLPFGFGVNTGTMTLSRDLEPRITAIKLPNGRSTINLGRHFYAHLYQLDIQGRTLSIFNVHLSAFDKNGHTRALQLKTLFDHAKIEREAGREVIIGGDFNMNFIAPVPDYKTAKKDIEWLVDFDEALLPKGYKVVIDNAEPSFRTLEKPYVIGENLTGFVDGFIVSAGINICSVKTKNLQYENSDHNPSTLVFSFNEKGASCG